MNEHDVMCQVRESFAALRMDMPVEAVFTRSRIRRRRRITGLTAVAAATAGTAAAVTLTVGAPAPAHASHPLTVAPGTGTSSPASPGAVTLAAFSVTSGPGPSTTLVLRKGPQYQLDANGLRQALAQHGIPALVTVGSFCRSTPAAPAGVGQVLRPLSVAGGQGMVINGQAMPPGTRLSIGYFPSYVRMALIEDGAHLSCASTSRQPAAHIPPSGTPVR